MTYRKEYALEGDFETRLGTVALRGTSSEREVVLVFDRIIDVSGHGTNEPRFHLFEDGWWTEVDPRRKRVVQRQVVPEGSDRDPFEIGEGPLPLPFGQKATDVLQRFDVTLVDVPDQPLFQLVKDAHVLHLIPKANTPLAQDHESVDLLFDKATLLPVGIFVLHKSGDQTTVWFREPKSERVDDVFTGRAGEAKKLLELASQESGWTIDRKPLPDQERKSEGVQ